MDKHDDQNREIVSHSKPQLKVLAQIPEDNVTNNRESSSVSQTTKTEPQKTLKKLGTAPAISVHAPTRPRVKTRTQEQRISSSRENEASRRVTGEVEIYPSGNQSSQAEPKKTLKKLGTAPAISVHTPTRPRVKPRTHEQRISPRRENEASRKATGEVEIYPSGNQSSQAEPKKILKKLGTAAAISVNKSARPSIRPKTQEQKARPSLGGGASGKAKLEAMGVKFKKKDNIEGMSTDVPAVKHAVKPPPPKPRPLGISPVKFVEKKDELAKEAPQTDIEEVATTQEKNKVEPLSLKTVIVSLNILNPPTALTYTLFGIWCVLLVVLASLFMMKIISL